MTGCFVCYFKGGVPFHQDEFGRGQPPLVRRSHHLFITLAIDIPSSSAAAAAAAAAAATRAHDGLAPAHSPVTVGPCCCGCRQTSPGSWRRFSSRDSWKVKVPTYESRGDDYPRRISRKPVRWYFLVPYIHRGIQLGHPFARRRLLTNDTARTVWTLSRYMASRQPKLATAGHRYSAVTACLPVLLFYAAFAYAQQADEQLPQKG